MTATSSTSSDPIARMNASLRAEAAIEPEAPATTAPTKKTEIIAIYGKGGSRQSFTLGTCRT